MAINKEDIEVGIVNSFDCKSIESRSEITEIERSYGKSKLPDDRRTFVCIGKDNNKSQWAEITSEHSNNRLEIQQTWRSWQDGDINHDITKRWKSETSYINGAVFEGPNDIWASLATDYNTQGRFKIVTQEGIEAIRAKLAPELQRPLFD
ncbi:hypothetical protein [Desulfovibrio piger]|uniref:hypothetical protein n=1 Tax=Desulfovibrio piger TaxID=901 RepID=UPI0030779405